MVTYYVIFQSFVQFATYFLSCSSDIFPLCHLASPNSSWNGVHWNKDDLLKKSFTNDFSFIWIAFIYFFKKESSIYFPKRPADNAQEEKNRKTFSAVAGQYGI